MKIIFVCLSFFVWLSAFAGADFDVVKDGVTYHCTAGAAGGGETCAEASLRLKGYILSDCKGLSASQDRCAAYSLVLKGYVLSDCKKLVEGGGCAIKSLQKSGYIRSDCFNIQNSRQDRCAVASLETKGYVLSDCLSL